MRIIIVSSVYAMERSFVFVVVVLPAKSHAVFRIDNEIRILGGAVKMMRVNVAAFSTNGAFPFVRGVYLASPFAVLCGRAHSRSFFALFVGQIGIVEMAVFAAPHFT